MNKERIKGIVIGFILCLTLSTTVMVVANTQTVTRQVTYGVRVNLNGELLHFDYDMRPFVMGSRTFLSVRAISEALEIPVDFDTGTNTVFLGDRQAQPTSPLNGTLFDSSVRPDFVRNPWSASSVTMGGMSYSNAIVYTTQSNGNATAISLHNLNGEYRILTGYIGRVDNTLNVRHATVSFTADDTLLATFNINANDLPTPFSLFVEDVRLLRIDISIAGGNFQNGSTSYAIVGELTR